MAKMKIIYPLFLLLPFISSTLAAPVEPATGSSAIDTQQQVAPASWRLDCGSPGTTALCSASNSGAHCDPVSGDLTIILAGTCSGCRCVSADQCSRGCGME
ncbi:uncharacterized protein GGS25DRAFT_522701 [Hypoxylon fragiforme]|uniref:uncharacterized protein n=1 Tax=Hypoxylon fragiforme TaxID=63214 RepID=UPI0020C62D25|nr:uncharacterized protein GGS25DRAFT_522701 [Hypoxylon fragiforme]KAI2607183.1 hypothetical protein GGS25DRAFT_522701 [Hypoxylon fragiforme]